MGGWKLYQFGTDRVGGGHFSVIRRIFTIPSIGENKCGYSFAAQWNWNYVLEGEILGILKESEGPDSVVIYLKKERAKKILPANWKVEAAGELMETLICKLGEKNVKLVEKNLINLGK